MTGGAELVAGFCDHLENDRVCATVTEWAEAYRWIQASSTPGKFSRDETPPMNAIADACGSSHPCSKVVLLKGNQIGGTQMAFNVVGERIHQSPCPILWVVPKADDIAGFVSGRFMPMRESTPVLRERMGRTVMSGKRATSRTEMVVFPGGYIKFGGSKPAETFQESAFGLVILDDYDRASENEDGDCIELAEKRTNTYSRAGAKVVIISTPTTAPSRTRSAFEESSQNRYHLPCLQCGTYQTLSWERLTWKPGAPDSAHFVCGHCGKAIYEDDKREMLLLGEWRPHRPEYTGRVEGFYLPAYYARSMSRTWAAIAKDWERAVHKLKTENDCSAMQVSTNLDRAEVWYPPELVQLHGIEADVYARRESADDVARAAAQAAYRTVGTDRQHNRLESSVYAWGTGMEGWLVQHGVHKGDTSKHEVWDEWATWVIAIGARAICVDASDQTTATCDEVTRLLPRFVEAGVLIWVIKGDEGRGQIWPKRIENGNVNTVTKRVQTVTVKVDECKTWVYSSLYRVKDSGPRFLHFSREISQAWFRQLFSWRERGSTDKPGRSRYVRVKGRRRDEALDCTNYALAALHGASYLDRTALHVVGVAATPSAAVQPKRQARTPKRPTKRRTWVNKPVL